MDLKSMISKINMGKKMLFLLVCVSLLATSLVGATATGADPIAQESLVEEDAPGGELGLLEVSPVINYQGRLLQDGQPYNGDTIMTFKLYDSQFGGGLVWQEPAMVTVSNGLFTHALGSVNPLSAEYFNRQLWLEIEVWGTELVPRQPLMACPYAMSLVPGASTVGAVDDAAFSARNTGDGVGVEATSESATEPALQATNSGGGPLISAWGADEKKFEVDQDGNLWIKGELTSETGTGRFPEPDWDSGWVTISTDEHKVLYHNLGGDVGRYFVDLTFLDDGTYGINTHGYGGLSTAGENRGAFWYGLDAQKITVKRKKADPYADKVRVRIWVY